MIEFEHTSYLLMIMILPPALVLFFLNIKKIQNAYAGFTEIKKIVFKAQFRAIFFSFAWIFLALSLACPLWGSKLVSIRRRGTSIIFVSDISKSMEAADVIPSRIAIQKQFLKKLSERLERSCCGIVLAKGGGILALPLTFEKNALIHTIDSISPDMFSSSGTNLEAGVICALNSFGSNRGNSKIIVLCTDGGETKGSLLNACEIAKKNNTALIIVGIGTTKGAPIKILDKNFETKSHITKLEEPFLIKAAKIAGNDSIYVSALDASALDTVFNRINQASEGVEKIMYFQEPIRRNFEMLLLSFLCICIGLMVFYDKKN